MSVVEVTSPTNIALIKYWGKHPKYPDLFIPTKSSVSFTVSSFYAKTHLRVEPGSGEVEFELNGRRIKEGESEFQYVHAFFERIAARFEFAKRFSYYVESKNNFPTASGFASSAAGFSALAFAFAITMRKLGEFTSLNDRSISILARLGSGSATRSIPRRGGLVIWHRGFDLPGNENKISEASFAESLYAPSHFEELVLFLVKADSRSKEIKSRAGMEDSVRSVYDYWQWVEYEESSLMPKLLAAVKNKKWNELFKLVKLASNNFHSICLRSEPPLMYLNDRSRRIIDSIHPLPHAAYTFDAGPNPVVITSSHRADEVKGVLSDIVGSNNITRSRVGSGPKRVY